MIIIWFFIKFHLFYWDLSYYFLIVSFFILFLIQLYKDSIIPKVPKLIFLLLMILFTLFYNFSPENRINPFLTGIWLIFFYVLIEKHYNKNIDNSKNIIIDNSNIFKNWKRNGKIIITIMGGAFLSAIIAYVLFLLFSLL